mgnify:CR=1 FL=1
MDVSNWADPSCRVRRQCRPRLVGLVGCEHVALSDVALADSAFWTLHVRRSRHVELSGLRVSGNRRFPNNDGGCGRWHGRLAGWLAGWLVVVLGGRWWG